MSISNFFTIKILTIALYLYKDKIGFVLYSPNYFFCRKQSSLIVLRKIKICIIRQNYKVV